MAEILEHPDKDNLAHEKLVEFGNMSVLIKNTDNVPLTVTQAVFVLEAAKALILQNWLDD